MGAVPLSGHVMTGLVKPWALILLQVCLEYQEKKSQGLEDKLGTSCVTSGKLYTLSLP